MREMEITAVAGTNESNQKALQALLEGYRKMLFPGHEVKDESLVQAKKMLAKEVESVYIVSKHGNGAAASLDASLRSKNPEIRKWAQHEKHKENMAQARLHERFGTKNVVIPKGVVEEKR